MVELTTECNLSCLHCFHSSERARLTPKQIISIALRIARDVHISHVVLTGGEPFVCETDTLVEAVEGVSRQGGRPHIVTNGTLCSIDALQRLAYAGLETLLVSLDGATSRTHDSIRGKAGAFERTVQSVRDARQLGLTVRVLFNVMRANCEEVARMIQLCGDLGVATLTLFRCTPVAWNLSLSTQYLSDDEWSELLVRDVEPSIRRGGDMRVLYEPTMIAQPDVARSLREAGFLASCMAKRREEVYLASDGSFYACQLALVPQLKLGSSKDQVTNGRAWQVLDNEEPTGCRDCELLSECRGGCRALAFRVSGCFEACDPRCVLNGQKIRLCPQTFTPPWTKLDSRTEDLFLPSVLFT